MLLKRISNIDLYNKLNALENKLDIMSKHSNAIYKHQLEEVEQDVNIKLGILRSELERSEDIPGILENLKRDIMDMFDKYTNKNYDVLKKHIDVVLMQLCSNERKLEHNTRTMETKLQDIYFENEIIKNNLYIQDELRTCSDNLAELKVLLDSALKEIDSIIN